MKKNIKRKFVDTSNIFNLKPGDIFIRVFKSPQVVEYQQESYKGKAFYHEALLFLSLETVENENCFIAYNLIDGLCYKVSREEMVIAIGQTKNFNVKEIFLKAMVMLEKGELIFIS